MVFVALSLFGAVWGIQQFVKHLLGSVSNIVDVETQFSRFHVVQMIRADASKKKCIEKKIKKNKNRIKKN